MQGIKNRQDNFREEQADCRIYMCIYKRSKIAKIVLRKVFTALDVKTWHKMRVRLWCSIRIDILIDGTES